MISPRKLAPLYSGKAKTLYTTDDDRYLIAEFRDDTTAFNGIKSASLQRKGEINKIISCFLMDQIAAHNIETHYVSPISPTEIIVKKLTMFPIESVVRNYAAGSLCKRFGIEHGLQLTPPLQEYFLKDDSLNDPAVSESIITHFNWASRAQLDDMRTMTLQVNDILHTLFLEAGMILADAKFEFGLSPEGRVTLADEISPDSCRVWDRDTGDSLDKDRFRKDLGDVVESYIVIAKRFGLDVS